MDQIMSGEATPAQIAGFLIALRAKGETVEEMRGPGRPDARPREPDHRSRVSLDIVGTGGDRAHTVNISTMAAMVCAAAGVRVVKHGNRAASSSSGSADVLEALGVDLALRPVAGGRGGRGGRHHVLLRPGLPPRRSGTPAVPRASSASPTAFNFLGPLTNPAQPTYAAVGCADARMAPLAGGRVRRPRRDAAVFRGDDGLDELTVATTSHVWWVRAGR